MTGSDQAALIAALDDLTARRPVPDGQPAPVAGDGAAARLQSILAAMAGVILPRCLTLADAAGRRLDLFLAHRTLQGWAQEGPSPQGWVDSNEGAWPAAPDVVLGQLASWAAGPCTLTVTRWDGPLAPGAGGLPVAALARVSAPSAAIPGEAIPNASPPHAAFPVAAITPQDQLDRFVAALDTAEAALIRIDGDAVTATDGAEPGLTRLIAFAEASWDDLLADPGPSDTAQLIVLTTAGGDDPGQAILLARAGATRLLLRFGAHLAVPVAALWLDCGQDAA